VWLLLIGMMFGGVVRCICLFGCDMWMMGVLGLLNSVEIFDWNIVVSLCSVVRFGLVMLFLSWFSSAGDILVCLVSLCRVSLWFRCSFCSCLFSM